MISHNDIVWMIVDCVMTFIKDQKRNLRTKIDKFKRADTNRTPTLLISQYPCVRIFLKI